MEKQTHYSLKKWCVVVKDGVDWGRTPSSLNAEVKSKNGAYGIVREPVFSKEDMWWRRVENTDE